MKPQIIRAVQLIREFLVKIPGVDAPGPARRLLIIVGAGAVALVIALTVVEPLVARELAVRERVVKSQRSLARLKVAIQSRPAWESEAEALSGQIEEMKPRLLKGETPQLLAASLQELVKDAGRQSQVGITNLKAEKPKQVDSVWEVPVTAQCSGNLVQLRQFLIALELGQTMLGIPEMTLKLASRSQPGVVQAELLVTGYSLTQP